MRIVTEDFFKNGTEHLDKLTNFVCEQYGLSYAELADKLGINRGWFTRMRKGGISTWTWGAVTGLVELAAETDCGVTEATLLRWISCEQIVDII